VTVFQVEKEGRQFAHCHPLWLGISPRSDMSAAIRSGTFKILVYA
jgi:hypothetical protein